MASVPTSPLRRIVLSVVLSLHTIILRSGRLSLVYRRSDESTPSEGNIYTLHRRRVHTGKGDDFGSIVPSSGTNQRATRQKTH